MTITQLQRRFEGSLNDFENCIMTKEQVLNEFSNTLLKWSMELLEHQQKYFMSNPSALIEENKRFGKIILEACAIDQNDPKALPLKDHIKEVRRELALREQVYKKQIEKKPELRPKLGYQYKLLQRQLWFLLTLEKFNIQSL